MVGGTEQRQEAQRDTKVWLRVRKRAGIELREEQERAHGKLALQVQLAVQPEPGPGGRDQEGRRTMSGTGTSNWDQDRRLEWSWGYNKRLAQRLTTSISRSGPRFKYRGGYVQ